VEDASKKLTWFSAPGGAFGAVPDDAELLHPVADDADPTSTETYWFVVNVPEHSLVANFYLKIRQTFQGCAAGGWIYRGIATDPLLVEHMNYHMSVPAPKLVASALHVPQAGLTFEIVKPTLNWNIRYRAKDGSAEATLACEARSPVVMTVSGEHFDQAIWCKGIIGLGDETFEIDAPGFRDRTWNAPRPEDKLDQPPLSYIYGVLDGGSASFCLRGGDDPAMGVEWQDMFPMTNAQMFHGGWLFVDGELRSIARMSKRTQRDFSVKARPLTQRIEFEDCRGAAHVLEGKVVGAMFYQPWGNVGAWMSNTEWTLDRRWTGYGEIQELMWSRYARKYWS
jgi:hypothetical protein